MSITINKKNYYSVIPIDNKYKTSLKNEDGYDCDICCSYTTKDFEALVVHVKSNCKMCSPKLNQALRNKYKAEVTN